MSTINKVYLSPYITSMFCYTRIYQFNTPVFIDIDKICSNLYNPENLIICPLVFFNGKFFLSMELKDINKTDNFFSLNKNIYDCLFITAENSFFPKYTYFTFLYQTDKTIEKKDRVNKIIDWDKQILIGLQENLIENSPNSVIYYK